MTDDELKQRIGEVGAQLVELLRQLAAHDRAAAARIAGEVQEVLRTLRHDLS